LAYVSYVRDQIVAREFAYKIDKFPLPVEYQRFSGREGQHLCRMQKSLRESPCLREKVTLVVYMLRDVWVGSMAVEEDDVVKSELCAEGISLEYSA
jgi:hypothetical protein